MLAFYMAENEQKAFCSLFKGEKVFENPNCSYKKLTLKTSAFSSNTLMVSATICVSAVSEVKSKDKALRHCKVDPDTSFHSSLGLYECTHRHSLEDPNLASFSKTSSDVVLYIYFYRPG